LIFKEFKIKYLDQDFSTEQINKLTDSVGDIYMDNPLHALTLLHQVDQNIVCSLKYYQKFFLKEVSQAIQKCYNQGGRLFFIGCGTSGRIAKQLESKWIYFFDQNKQYGNNKILNKFVQSIIAGGPHALINAQPRFEDGYLSGQQALINHNITSNDLVILISASGSPQFNIGAGEYAHKKNAKVFYFYNNKSVPQSTQTFLDHPDIQPILIESGPQAIAGSTRLQAASLTIFCLGNTLNIILSEILNIDIGSDLIKFSSFID